MARQRARPQPTADPSPHRRPIPRSALRGSRGAAIGSRAAVPEANLDDHRMWAARIGTMADAVVVLAAALFALMILAMGTAIGFATRGAMAGNREIVEVLHLVGASDAFIAREFQTHFRRLGFRGSIIGGLAAMAFFAAASLLSFSWAHSPGGEEIAAMFGVLRARSLRLCRAGAGLRRRHAADRPSLASDRHPPFASADVNKRLWALRVTCWLRWCCGVIARALVEEKEARSMSHICHTSQPNFSDHNILLMKPNPSIRRFCAQSRVRLIRSNEPTET